MNHVAEVDRLHLSMPLVSTSFWCNKLFYFIRHYKRLTMVLDCPVIDKKLFHLYKKVFTNEITTAWRKLENGGKKQTVLFNMAGWWDQVNSPLLEKRKKITALLIISLIGETGDTLSWNIVCVLRLSSTLPENIDLHFTFHCVARCCAFINQHGGAFMVTNVFRVLLLSVHFSSLTKQSLSITIWPTIVA